MSELNRIWCCLACRWKGRAGDTRIIPGRGCDLRCPECECVVTVADGEARSTAVWHGEKPAVLN